MKILFVNNQLQLGGAETVVHQLRAGLTEAGHDHRLYVAQGKTYPWSKTIRPFYPRLLSRLSHTRLHTAIDRLFPRFQWTDRAFRRLAQERGDLVHLHNFHGDYASIQSLAFLAAHKPVLWTFHRFWGITGGCDHPRDCRRYQEACGQCPQVGQWPIGPVDHTAEELLLKCNHLARAPLHIVAPSQHLAQMVRDSRVGKKWDVSYIPNGVNPQEFKFSRKRDPDFRAGLGLAREATLVLVVNRNFQDPLKGFDVIEDALGKLRNLPPAGLQILLAGQNSDWAASRLPPALDCRSLGYIRSRSAMAELYEAADIFLFASPAENFPCVTLEAMSCKCCVVATPASGLPEQIEHHRSGLLSAEVTGPSLAAVLEEALANPGLCRTLGDAARARVERDFSEKEMINRHLALYEQVGKADHRVRSAAL